MKTSSGSNQIVQNKLPKGHFFTTSYNGPWVILTCSCSWHMMKLKQFSAEATSAAKLHVAENNRKLREKQKYEDYVGVSKETLTAAYKKVRWNSAHDAGTGGMVHGSNAHAGTPRLAKHQPTVAGIRIK